MVQRNDQRIDPYLRGDRDAFLEIDGWIRAELQRRYPRLSNETDDLAQSIHQKLVANLRAGRFQGRSRLRTYVVGIVHHTAIDRLREIYSERALASEWSKEPRAAEYNPYGSIEALDDEKLLFQVLQTLPASCRELWSLVFVERLSYPEIAGRLSIPPGTVKSRMWHCRRKAIIALRRLGRRWQ